MLNELQARNWAAVADRMSARYAVTVRRWLEHEDLVQAGLLAILELSDGADLLDKAWALRQGMRNVLDQVIRDRPELLDEDPWLGPDEPVHESWLAMLNEPDSLTRRLRTAYSDDEQVADAVAANYVGGGYRDEDWLAIEGYEIAETIQVEETWDEPEYMQPEWRMDDDEVDLVATAFGEGFCISYAAGLAKAKSWGGVRFMATELVKMAFGWGLTPPECAHLVNVCACEMVKRAPTEEDAALWYSVFRNGAGDHMALCEPPGAVLRPLEEDVAPLPRGTEFPAAEQPGLCSGYGIEDDETWMRLFPDGPGEERHTLPQGSEAVLQDLLGYVHARTQPEDVSWDGEYTGWKLWDTEVARKTFLEATLRGASWKEAALMGRRAFWNLPAASRNGMLRRNYLALEGAGLTIKPELGYKVVPVTAVTVDSLTRSGVRSNGQFHPFGQGHMDLIVQEDKVESFLNALAQTEVGAFHVIGV